MGRNNNIYSMYQEMLDGFKTDNEGLFEHGTRCLMSLDPEVPFEVGSSEYELFYRTLRFYKTWEHGGVGSKVSYTRMLNKAKELCSCVNYNPFNYSEEEEMEDLKAQKKLEEQRKKEQKKIEQQTEDLKKIKEQNKKKEPVRQVVKEVKLEDSEHILGIVPEEEQEKEKKNWFNFLFPWKKEGE